MDANRTQKIDPSPIALVSRRVDSISFDGGKADEKKTSIKARFNISNSLVNRIEDEDGNTLLCANLVVSIEPEEESGFYSLELSVSGLFALANGETSHEEFERSVLTDGISELYAFAESIASAIVQGGTFGDLKFPILRISI